MNEWQAGDVCAADCYLKLLSLGRLISIQNYQYFDIMDLNSPPSPTINIQSIFCFDKKISRNLFQEAQLQTQNPCISV